MSDEGGVPPARRGAFPPTRKSLGQHFLSDRRILARIADALHLRGHETVLEIGPGRGALTDILAERAGRLIAIEYDRALAAMLRERYARRSNVLIAEADVLEVSLGDLAAGPYVLVGNVPYYITTPILFRALVRITPLPEPLVRADEERRFRVLVQSAFGMRRKQMRRVVRTMFSLDSE